MRIYIQTDKGVPKFDFCYSMYVGALHHGVLASDIIMFEDIMEAPANRNNVVVASVEDTIVFFERCGIEVPKAINLYVSLKEAGYLKRACIEMTLNEFRTFRPELAYFIKPLSDTKAFVSGVIKKRSLLPALLSDYKGSWDINILVSSPVNFVSEYRLFWRRKREGEKQIAGFKHYQGDPMIYPDNGYIKRVLEFLQRHTDLPASLTVDFGIDDNGDTQVVELNDGWCCGSYGLEGETYYNFFMDRWNQLMKN